MVTLKDMVGNFTLVKVPTQPFRVLFALAKKKHAETKYLFAVATSESMTSSAMWYQQCVATTRLYDKMIYSQHNYEREKTKLKSLFKIKG